MKNIKYTMAISILLSSFLITGVALAHGSIELIECHNKDSSLVLRGEALNKENDFKLEIKNKSETIWTAKKTRLKLKDVVENGKVFESITLETKDGTKANLKVQEVYHREIRNGSGTLENKKVSAKDLSCYALY